MNKIRNRLRLRDTHAPVLVCPTGKLTWPGQSTTTTTQILNQFLTNQGIPVRHNLQNVLSGEGVPGLKTDQNHVINYIAVYSFVLNSGRLPWLT
ncbi:MAG: hypothetical protein BWY82_01549 [Verrucomicrobia bacterium ADurb.Bin474]|nr:MAG: hypothetical protein BWY82_01549 [Verrucomicrobia bacterium ADurb.Bin474]